MKRPYRHRWYHDPDAREFALATVVAFAATAVGLWRPWQATDPGRGEGRGARSEAEVEGQCRVDGPGSRVEGQRED